MNEMISELHLHYRRSLYFDVFSYWFIRYDTVSCFRHVSTWVNILPLWVRGPCGKKDSRQKGGCRLVTFFFDEHSGYLPPFSDSAMRFPTIVTTNPRLLFQVILIRKEIGETRALSTEHDVTRVWLLQLEIDAFSSISISVNLNSHLRRRWK